LIASWVWAISIGAGISGIVLSWWLKVPVVTAWSAPGTALLVTLFPAMPLSQVIAAYLTSAVVLFLIGISGYFDKLIRHIPKGIAAGMMAGILFQFGVNTFKSIAVLPLLSVIMIVTYIVFRKILPRYAIVLVLLISALIAMLTGVLNLSTVELHVTTPV
jgi:benzoate membrane transport protein